MKNVRKWLSWKTYGELRKRDYEIADMLPDVTDRITEEKARRMGLTLRQYKAAEKAGIRTDVAAAYIRHQLRARREM